MSMLEDRSTGPSLQRKALLLASVLFLIALILNSLFGSRGMLHLAGQRERVSALQSEIDKLRSDNHRLTLEIAALRSDPAAIERIAREELGYARPDETLYLLSEPGSLSQ
jgi:cell division protein FtsB